MIPTNEKTMMSEGMLLLPSIKQKKKTSIYSLNDNAHTPEVFESPTIDESGDHQTHNQENLIKQECWRKSL